jgi:hypothetical protein
MTPIADMVERMLAGGVSHDAIVLAIRTIEQRDASRDGVTLSVTPGALRARRHRQNRKQNQGGAKANDVAAFPQTERDASRDGVTDHCDLTSSLSSLSSFQQVKEEKKKVSGTEQVEGRKTRDAAPA